MRKRLFEKSLGRGENGVLGAPELKRTQQIHKWDLFLIHKIPLVDFVVREHRSAEKRHLQQGIVEFSNSL
jgi:hypothetical protein